jgi:hypothetical protein
MSRRSRIATPLSVTPLVPSHEPDLAREHKEVVIAALRWAWNELARRAPELLRSGQEENITTGLQYLLNERRDGVRIAPGLLDFETVSRGAKQRTSDGRVGKEPDLTFRPVPYPTVRNTTCWGWFVECKIIDGGGSVTLYREYGVKRFSGGEYAAWMPSGAMLAYVRDGLRPAHALHKALVGQTATISHRPGLTKDRSESEHDRSLLVPPCVNVVLTHIWLPVPR